MNNTLGLKKQRQLEQTDELKRSFKATTNLATGIMRERVTVQHELHKISNNKAKLEELKVLK